MIVDVSSVGSINVLIYSLRPNDVLRSCELEMYPANPRPSTVLVNWEAKYVVDTRKARLAVDIRDSRFAVDTNDVRFAVDTKDSRLAVETNPPIEGKVEI